MIKFYSHTKFTIAILFIFLLHFSSANAQPFTSQTGISLISVSNSSVAWGDYDNDGDLDILLTGDSQSGRVSKVYSNNGNNTFSEQTGISLTGVYYGSVAWGDYDNDGDLDILLTGYTGFLYVSKVYRNDGNNTFTEQTGIVLTGVKNSSVAWGDYDNDGDLDILLTGDSQSGRVSKVYSNNGNNTFTEQTGIILVGVGNSSVAWVDYDNDGDLDILLTGYTGSFYVSKIYNNNGCNTFVEQTNIMLAGVGYSSVAWGDYDGDGYLDIILTGYTGSSDVSKIYRNNGNNTFTEQTGIGLVGVSDGSVAWGDYDNDGDLDLLLIGNTISNIATSKIYRNNGNNSFAEQPAIGLLNTDEGSIAWGDYDKDGDLDILLTGYSSGHLSRIYRNDTPTPNTVPAAPGGLTSATEGNNIVLRWNAVKTDATPAEGLTYNIRVGKTSNANDVVSSMSVNNGLRLLACMGNTQTDTTFVLHNLAKGTYYWSVQVVDNTLAGGAFATEQTFAYNANYPASALAFIIKDTVAMKCTWTRGNNDKCVVFAKENASGTASPVNNSTYNGNKIFGSGTQIGTSGWYCVYNGPLDSITVTGLKPYTSYAFHVLEYNGTAGAEQYLTIDEPTAHAIQSTKLFEQKGISLTGVCLSSVAWGDYDNDGDLDILLTGQTGTGGVTKIYRNDGNQTFTDQTGMGLIGVLNSAVAWGDYDNDGDLDILLTGVAGTSYISKIYRNNGNNTFTDQTEIVLTGVYDGSVSWGDYDNDGDLDILLTGYSKSGRVSKIYRNNGNNTFTDQTEIVLVNVSGSSAAWGDYDNDGDLDILLAGRNTDSTFISKIYRNNGNNTFSEQTDISLTAVGNSSVAWGDYDNDGDLDILLAGSIPSYTSVSKIYRNNGNNTFTEQTGINLTGAENGSVVWGDYDNDGDLDILLTGYKSGYVSKIYRNTNGTFLEQKDIVLPAVSYGSVAWGDYDNDGDLDILLTGNTGNSYISQIFRNSISPVNIAPAVPTGQTSAIEGKKIVMRWNPVKTDATPAKGLTYNIRVGKTSNANDVVSSMSANNGLRQVAFMGNGQTDTTFVLSNLAKGTYYWSVQAVDNSLAGGVFVPEQTFNYTVDYPATALTFLSRGSTSMKCKWTRGNGDKCVVFVKENGSAEASPVNNTNYSGNKVFGSGAQIGTSGWFCVYNGTLDTVMINGLKPYTSYAFHVLEYSGAASAEKYYDIDEPTARAIQNTDMFTEQKGIVLVGVKNGAVAWSDFDKDGDLDILLTGNIGSSYITRIASNNGNGTFTMRTGLPDVGNSSVSWGDYDNDGRLDLLLTGSTSLLPISRICRNDNGNSFPQQVSITLPDVEYSSVAWGDYDNDGDLDILLTGGSTSGPVSRIYRNNGNNTFTEQTNIVLPGVFKSSVAWGDYDNDGDLDILLTGQSFSNAISKIYRNNGNGTFTEQLGISLTGVHSGSVAWGDYDNDGNLDILLTGSTGYDCISKVYHNNGDNTFTEQTGIVLTGVQYSSVAWGDYDNDGYLDILLTGQNGSAPVSKIYRNNGDGTFTAQTYIALTDVYGSSVTWGDYDNDGDLDILLTGYSATGSCISKIYRNDVSVHNVAPAAPSGLNIQFSGTEAKFTWNKSVDDKTASNGLSYTLYLYETSKTGYIKSPEALPASHLLNGRRCVARIGNIQYSSSGYIVKGLVTGNYKWSVQAVDAGLLGSAFSVEGPVNTIDLLAVGINVAASQITGTTSEMEYSISSTDGINGIWNSCSIGNTSVSFNTGGFDVWVRQYGNNSNNRKVAAIALQAAAPAYTINYLTEKTTENIPATVEYSINLSMSGASSSNGNAVSLTPGTKLYIRTKPTTSTVVSAIQTLTVPVRPEAPSVPVVDDMANTFDWTNNSSFTNILEYEYSINNGVTWTVCSVKPILVGNVNLSSGTVKVRVKATSVNFTGVALVSNAAFTISTGIVSLHEAGITMRPNPVTDILYLENVPEKSQITIYTIDGRLVKENINAGDKTEILVNDLPLGLYLIRIKTVKIETQAKFVKE